MHAKEPYPDRVLTAASYAILGALSIREALSRNDLKGWTDRRNGS
jgi:hypothetical protein